jgi:hypothetical protein
MSDVNTYMDRFRTHAVTAAALRIMRLSLWLMGRLLLRVAALKSPDEAVPKRLGNHGRDEENRTSWSWSPGRFEARADEGFRKVFLPPQPGLGHSESMWTVLVSSAKAPPGKRPIRARMLLPEVLRRCGVEKCRRAMVLAHQRATVDARRREADLDGTRRVSVSLERQLVRAGEVVPRVGAFRRLRNQVVDILRGPRHGRGDDPDEFLLEPKELVRLGCYASVPGGSQDREIVVIGSDDDWTVFDFNRGKAEDVRYLPKSFRGWRDAVDEGNRRLELARLNGGPSPDFK